MDQVEKRIEMACGCVETVTVRPRESRMYLKVGQSTTCGEHGEQTITVAEEISGNVPLLKEILGRG